MTIKLSNVPSLLSLLWMVRKRESAHESFQKFPQRTGKRISHEMGHVIVR